MIIPTKKLKNGFEMPVYGLGTWEMGGGTEHNPNNDDKADINAIKTAIDLGITHIDTAERYANGYAETLIGKAIKGNERKNLFLVSKVSPYHLRYANVIAAAEASIKRLQASYIDLYLIHSPNPDIPINETMRAMDSLKNEGLIKNIGVSNFNVDEMKKAQAATKNSIVANQLHYNLKYREAERKGLVKYCQENDVILIAWRPLQKGVLLQGDNNFVKDLRQKYQKTPSQIALNWLISQKNVVTLSKTRNIEHLKENLGAVGWEMDKEDIKKLSNEFPDQEDISDSVPLN